MEALLEALKQKLASLNIVTADRVTYLHEAGRKTKAVALTQDGRFVRVSFNGYKAHEVKALIGSFKTPALCNDYFQTTILVSGLVN